MSYFPLYQPHVSHNTEYVRTWVRTTSQTLSASCRPRSCHRVTAACSGRREQNTDLCPAEGGNVCVYSPYNSKTTDLWTMCQRVTPATNSQMALANTTKHNNKLVKDVSVSSQNNNRGQIIADGTMASTVSTNITQLCTCSGRESLQIGESLQQKRTPGKNNEVAGTKMFYY